MSLAVRLSAIGTGLLAMIVAGAGSRIIVAHCDGLDGPVVQAAERALATGNVNFALVWVPAEEEDTIRHAFTDSTAVRRLGGDARRLADRLFAETLVRLHRASEGAPYEGLKPAGRDFGPAIRGADRAIAIKSAANLEAMLADAVRRGLADRHARLMSLRDYDVNDVPAGRRYAAAYVDFVHYADGVYAVAVGTRPDHHQEK